MPYYLAIGVTYERFMDSCPKELEPFAEAHKIRLKEQDKMNWFLGQYFASALDSTVCNSEIWRRKGSKPHQYIEKPILQKMEEENKPLSEDELQRQRELFVAKLEVMKTNFELNYKGGKRS